MQLLQDVFIIENLQVLSESNSKRMKIKGVFGRCNEKNNNGRIYPTKVLESQLRQISSLIKERRLCGELDHPQNDTVKLSNASHLITSLEFRGNDLIGEAEILDTPAGLTAKALINGGVKIGISSRGMGTLSEDKEGNKIVNEDYRLVTFDLVSDPSTRGAFPGLSESTQYKYAKDTKTKLSKEQIFVTMLENKFNKEFNLDEGSLGMAKTLRREKAFVNAAIKGDASKRNALGKKLDKANSKKDLRRKQRSMERRRTDKSIQDYEARKDAEHMRFKESYGPLTAMLINLMEEDDDEESDNSTKAHLLKTKDTFAIKKDKSEKSEKPEGALSRYIRRRGEIAHERNNAIASAQGAAKGAIIKAKAPSKAGIIKAIGSGIAGIVGAKYDSIIAKTAGVGAAKAKGAIDRENLKQKGKNNKALRRLNKYGSTSKVGVAANLIKRGLKAGGSALLAKIKARRDAKAAAKSASEKKSAISTVAKNIKAKRQTMNAKASMMAGKRPSMNHPAAAALVNKSKVSAKAPTKKKVPMEAPAKATKAPVKSAKVPAKATKAPLGKPNPAMKNPFGVNKGKKSTKKIPIKTLGSKKKGK